MRTLSAASSAAQKRITLTPRVKVALTAPASGGTSVTYDSATIGRIHSIEHTEEQYSQRATIVLSNVDEAIAANLEGFKVVISYAVDPPGTYSDTAPMYVLAPEEHSSPGRLLTQLQTLGIPDLLAMDRANSDFEPELDEIATVKDRLTEVLKGVLPDWVADTVTALDDLVKPVVQNGYIFKATTIAGDFKTHATTEPTWTTVIGATYVDDQVTWTNIGREITAFSHVKRTYTPTFDSEDYLLDVFKPADAFLIRYNQSRLDYIMDLLFFTKCVFRAERDGAVHIFVPTVEGPAWEASTLYQLNDYVHPTGTPTTNVAFKCTARAGDFLSGASEPTWDYDVGDTTDDDTNITWTAIDFDYEYKLTEGEHFFLTKANRSGLVMPNHVTVESHPDSDDNSGAGYSGTAEHKPSSDITDFEVRDHQRYRLVSNADAASLAVAILEGYVLEAQQGSFTAPLNVAQEIHDFVQVTDARHSNKKTFGNVGAILRTVRSGEWHMRIALGGLNQGGFLGMDVPPWMVQDELEFKIMLGMQPRLGEAPNDVPEDLPWMFSRLLAAEQLSTTMGSANNMQNLALRIAQLEKQVLGQGIFLRQVHYVNITAATYTIKDKDDIIGVNRAGVVTVTLPTAAVVKGRVYVVKDESGAAGTNTITIATEGSETIDGAATDTLTSNYGAFGYYSDGTNWMVVSPLTESSIASQELNCFSLQINNNAGVLRHRMGFGQVAATTASNFIDRIANASTTYANMATGTDADTAFVSGCKVSTTNAYAVVFDVAAQTTANGLATAVIQNNSTGHALNVGVDYESFDVNGTTQNRMSFYYTNASSAAAFNINPTNIPSGKSLVTRFYGHLT